MRDNSVCETISFLSFVPGNNIYFQGAFSFSGMRRQVRETATGGPATSKRSSSGVCSPFSRQVSVSNAKQRRKIVHRGNPYFAMGWRETRPLSRTLTEGRKRRRKLDDRKAPGWMARDRLKKRGRKRERERERGGEREKEETRDKLEKAKRR